MKIKFNQEYFFYHFSYFFSRFAIFRFLILDLIIFFSFYYVSSVVSFLDFFGLFLFIALFLLTSLFFIVAIKKIEYIYFWSIFSLLVIFLILFLYKLSMLISVKAFVFFSIFIFLPYIFLNAEYHKNGYVRYFFRSHASRFLKFFRIRRFRVFRYYLFIFFSFFRYFHQIFLILFDKFIKVILMPLKRIVWIFVPEVFYASLLIFIRFKVSLFTYIKPYFWLGYPLKIYLNVKVRPLFNSLDLFFFNVLTFIASFDFNFFNFMFLKDMKVFSFNETFFFQKSFILYLQSLDLYWSNIVTFLIKVVKYCFVIITYFYSLFLQIASFIPFKKILKLVLYFFLVLIFMGLINWAVVVSLFFEFGYLFGLYLLKVWYMIDDATYLGLVFNQTLFPNIIYMWFSSLCLFISSSFPSWFSSLFLPLFKWSSWLVYLICKYIWIFILDLILLFSNILVIVIDFYSWFFSSYFLLFSSLVQFGVSLFLLDPFWYFWKGSFILYILECYNHFNLYLYFLSLYFQDSLSFWFSSFNWFKYIFFYYWWFIELLKVKFYFSQEFPAFSWNIFSENFEYFYRSYAIRTHEIPFFPTEWEHKPYSEYVSDFSTHQHLFVFLQASMDTSSFSSLLLTNTKNINIFNFSMGFLRELENLWFHPFFVFLALNLWFVVIFFFFKEFRNFLGFSYKTVWYSPNYLLALFLKKTFNYSKLPLNTFIRSRFFSLYRWSKTLRSNIKNRNVNSNRYNFTWNDVFSFLKEIGCSKKDILIIKNIYFSKSKLQFLILFEQIWFKSLAGHPLNKLKIKSDISNNLFNYLDKNNDLVNFNLSLKVPSSAYLQSLNYFSELSSNLNWLNYSFLVKFHYDPEDSYVLNGLHDQSLNKYKNVSWPYGSFDDFLNAKNKNYFSMVFSAFLLDELYKREDKITNWSSSDGSLDDFWQNVPEHFYFQNVSWVPIDVDPAIVKFSDNKFPFQNTRRKYTGFFNKATYKFYDFFKFLNDKIFFNSLPLWSLNNDWFFAESYLFDDANSSLPSPVSFDFLFIWFILFSWKFYFVFITRYWLNEVDVSVLVFFFSYFVFFNDFVSFLTFPLITSNWDVTGVVDSVSNRFYIHVVKPELRSYALLYQENFLYFPDFLEYSINGIFYTDFIGDFVTVKFAKPFFFMVGFFYKNILFLDLFPFIKSYFLVFFSSAITSIYSLTNFNFYFFFLINFKLILKFYISLLWYSKVKLNRF